MSVLGANLLIELLCWEVNQGLQSIKSTTISFPTFDPPRRMCNSNPFEYEVERSSKKEKS